MIPDLTDTKTHFPVQNGGGCFNSNGNGLSGLSRCHCSRDCLNDCSKRSRASLISGYFCSKKYVVGLSPTRTTIPSSENPYGHLISPNRVDGTNCTRAAILAAKSWVAIASALRRLGSVFASACWRSSTGRITLSVYEGSEESGSGSLEGGGALCLTYSTVTPSGIVSSKPIGDGLLPFCPLKRG
jgi:hypothetical protein